jgi:hypothetical protein
LAELESWGWTHWLGLACLASGLVMMLISAPTLFGRLVRQRAPAAKTPPQQPSPRVSGSRVSSSGTAAPAAIDPNDPWNGVPLPAEREPGLSPEALAKARRLPESLSVPSRYLDAVMAQALARSFPVGAGATPPYQRLLASAFSLAIEVSPDALQRAKEDLEIKTALELDPELGFMELISPSHGPYIAASHRTFPTPAGERGLKVASLVRSGLRLGETYVPPWVEVKGAR